MSVDVWIDGKLCKCVTISDIAPNGIEELRDLLKQAAFSPPPAWAVAPPMDKP